MNYKAKPYCPNLRALQFLLGLFAMQQTASFACTLHNIKCPRLA